MPGRARRSRAALVCAAVCIPSLAAAGDAAAVVVPCNSIITTSVTLSNDIRDCHRAIRVDADNVTINLNGHTISNADSSQQSVAIDSQGHTGLTGRSRASPATASA